MTLAAPLVLASGDANRALMHVIIVAIVVVAALVGVRVWRRHRNAEQLSDDDFGARSGTQGGESFEPGGRQ